MQIREANTPINFSKFNTMFLFNKSSPNLRLFVKTHDNNRPHNEYNMWMKYRLVVASNSIIIPSSVYFLLSITKKPFTVLWSISGIPELVKLMVKESQVEVKLIRKFLEAIDMLSSSISEVQWYFLFVNGLIPMATGGRFKYRIPKNPWKGLLDQTNTDL